DSEGWGVVGCAAACWPHASSTMVTRARSNKTGAPPLDLRERRGKSSETARPTTVSSTHRVLGVALGILASGGCENLRAAATWDPVRGGNHASFPAEPIVKSGIRPGRTSFVFVIPAQAGIQTSCVVRLNPRPRPAPGRRRRDTQTDRPCSDSAPRLGFSVLN